MPTKRPKKLPDAHPRYALRRRTGCRGDRGLSATATTCQPSSRVQSPSQLPPKQRHINLVEVKYCEDTRPRSQLEAAHHQHSVLCQHLAQLRPILASTLSGSKRHHPQPSLEPLKHLGLDPQKVTKKRKERKTT